MKKAIKIISIIVIVIGLILTATSFAKAQSFNLWVVVSNRLEPILDAWGINITGDTTLSSASTTGSHYVGQLSVGSGARTYYFPATDGSANQILKTDGAGSVTWQADNTGGVGGAAYWTAITDAIHHNTTTDTVLIGKNTLIDGSRALEVLGNSYFDGNATTTGHLAALGGNSDQWNLAFGWGDHSIAGYYAAADFNSDFDTRLIATTTWSGDLLVDGSATTTGSMYIGNDLTVLNGRVGIGTVSPSSAFHIKANVSGTVGSHPAGQLIIQDPDDSVFGNAVITGYESDGAGNPDQQLWYLGSASSGSSDVTFLNRRSAKLTLGTGGTSRITILGNGNVGIGTTTPDSLLTVDGTFAVGTNGTEFIVDANGNATSTATTTAQGFKGLNLISCDTIDTNAEGHLACGTDADTQLTEEEVEDYVGGMFGGTETLISVTYNDGDNDIDFVVNNDLNSYDWSNADTDDLSEGAANFYYTQAQWDADFIGTSTWPAFDSLFDTRLNASTTRPTDADVTAEIATHAGDDDAHHDPVTVAGTPNYITLAGQELTLTKLDMNDDTNLTIGATGIELSTNDIALTAGYIIPKSASTTNWNDFYDAPSDRITAGDNLAWDGNTLDAAAGNGIGPAWEYNPTFIGMTPTSTQSGIYLYGSATTSGNFYADGFASTTEGLFTQGGGHIGGALTIDGNLTVQGDIPGFMADGDINSFSELQSWVGDKTLVNEEDIFTIDANWVNTANPWDISTETNLSGGTNITLNGDAIDLDPTISLTGLVAVNATSTGSWVIPHGAAPDIDAAGEIGLDETDNQFLVADSGGTARVVPLELPLFAFDLPSTSPDLISGGIIHIAKWTKDGRSLTQFRCHVDGGTSVVANVSDDGTNDTESITCATTQTSDTDVATNDTFTADELWRVEIGTVTGAVDYLVFEAYGYITRE